jgi:hypothetical protein
MDGLVSGRPWTVESDLTYRIFISCVPVRCKGEGKKHLRCRLVVSDSAPQQFYSRMLGFIEEFTPTYGLLRLLSPALWCAAKGR